MTPTNPIRSECCGAEVRYRYCAKCGQECRINQMTTTNRTNSQQSERLEPPDRIWIDVDEHALAVRNGEAGHYFLTPDKESVEYTRAAVAGPGGVIELLSASLLHPESAESYVRQAIEMLSAAAASSTTPAESESPILAFEKWLMRYVEDCGKLSQKEYGIAYAAFIAAHPGEGPLARTMNAAPPERKRAFFDAGFSTESTREAGEQK